MVAGRPHCIRVESADRSGLETCGPRRGGPARAALTAAPSLQSTSNRLQKHCGRLGPLRGGQETLPACSAANSATASYRVGASGRYCGCHSNVGDWPSFPTGGRSERCGGIAAHRRIRCRLLSAPRSVFASGAARYERNDPGTILQSRRGFSAPPAILSLAMSLDLISLLNSVRISASPLALHSMRGPSPPQSQCRLSQYRHHRMAGAAGYRSQFDSLARARGRRINPSKWRSLS